MNTVFVVSFGCTDLEGEAISSVCATEALGMKHARMCAEEQAGVMTEMEDEPYVVIETNHRDGVTTTFSVVREGGKFGEGVEWYIVSEHPLLVA